MKKKVQRLFSILILFALILSACSTAQQAEPVAEAEPTVAIAATEAPEAATEVLTHGYREKTHENLDCR